MYTNTIKYYDTSAIFDEGIDRFETGASQNDNERYMTGSPVYTRAHEVFNQAAYMYPAPPVYMGARDIDFPQQERYVLRLLIKQPGSSFMLPKTLSFLQPIIHECDQYQQNNFPDYKDRFVYLTVRSGGVKSQHDDQFHVDGFQGISVPRHIPEQNYIWVDKHPTIFSMQPYFVEDLDPAKHNFQNYFNMMTAKDGLLAVQEKGLYIIDPYHVHKRPEVPIGTQRSFMRICYSPVEIRDDTNTFNPYLPRGPYNREDVRNYLTDSEPRHEAPERYGLKALKP